MNDNGGLSPRPAPPPHGVAAAPWRWSQAAAQFSGAAIGIQFLVALVVRIGPLAPWPRETDLTHIGQTIVHPEFDVLAFVAGCAVCVACIAANAVTWRRLALRIPAERRIAVVRWSTVVQAAGAIIGLIVFAIVVEVLRRAAYNRWVLSPIESAALFSPPALSILALLIARGVALHPWEFLALTARFYGVTRHFRILSAIAAFAAMALIAGLVYVPYPGHLAGAVYAVEEFFHWDHFIMTPAVGFAAGKALGTEIPLQYGIGGPLVLAAAKPWLGLSYEGALHAGVLYACAYYAGLFALLRLALRNTAFALGATLIGLWLTMWAPVFADLATVWQWPSSTVLRSPFDVWFLLALFLDGQKQSTWRLLAAGVIAGLAAVFNTDSGLSIVLLFAIYSAWRIWDAEGRRPRAALEVAGAGSALAAVAVAVLVAASRGTIFTQPRAFFSGWLDGLVGYAGSGAGSLVFLSRIHLGDIALLMAVMAVYLLAVGHAVLRAWTRELNGPGMVLACASLYGLARLVIFFQRTLPNNLYHTAVPAVIVAGLAAGPWLDAWMARGRPWRPLPPLPVVRGALGGALLLLAAILLWNSPAFREYPGAVRVAIKGAPDRGISLLPGMAVHGLPEDLRQQTADVQAGVEALRALAKTDARIAVVDHRSTLYYLATGIKPWRGDSSLFYNTFTLDQQRALAADLAAAQLDYVLIRAEPPQPYFVDTWRVCRDVITRQYIHEGEAGLFEIWKRPAGPAK